MPTYPEDNQPCEIDSGTDCLTHGQPYEVCQSEIADAVEDATNILWGDGSAVNRERCPYCGWNRAVGGVCNGGC